jgi:hypothetical protein
MEKHRDILDNLQSLFPCLSYVGSFDEDGAPNKDYLSGILYWLIRANKKGLITKMEQLAIEDTCNDIIRKYTFWE